MKLKLDDKGNAVVQDGKPVYVDDKGAEIAFDAPGTIATIGRLNGEAKGHRERAEKAEGDLKKFEGIIDPEAAKKALGIVKNLDDKKLVDAGEVDKVKQEAIKASDEKYQPFVKKAEQLEAQLNAHLIGGAFAGSEFIAKRFAAEGPAGVEFARSIFEKNFKVEDGKVVAVDGNGQKLFSRARPGELASPEEAIEMLVDASPHKAHLLKPQGSGGGAGGHKNGDPNLAAKKAQEMKPEEKAAFIKEHGMAKWQEKIDADYAKQ